MNTLIYLQTGICLPLVNVDSNYILTMTSTWRSTWTTVYDFQSMTSFFSVLT